MSCDHVIHRLREGYRKGEYVSECLKCGTEVGFTISVLAEKEVAWWRAEFLREGTFVIGMENRTCEEQQKKRVAELTDDVDIKFGIMLLIRQKCYNKPCSEW